MIVTFLRSSSIGSYKFCPHRYNLEYLLGIPGSSNKKANKGSVTHKVLEACALYKFALQKGEKSYDLPDIGTFSTELPPDLEDLNRRSFLHYKSLSEYCDWNEEDEEECLQWTNLTLEWDSGAYSPLKCNIFGVEQFFELQIMEDWAAYSYKSPNGGESIEGYLGIKGNIDFILDRGESHLTLLDWKTGKRISWDSNPPKYKTYKDLVNDDQLLLYSYAFHKMYPWAMFDQTIFYVNDGGPVTIPRGEEDFQKAEDMLKTYFNKIRNDKLPKKNVTFKCKKFCHYGMNKFEGTDELICDHVHSNMIENGLYQVMREFGKPNNWERYGSGGGKVDK